MINFEALFKISYGLYLVTSGDKDKGNGFISNTFFQVTSEPPQFAACCNKDNYTSEIIEQSGKFAVSILHQETKPDLFGRFGYRTGKEFDKLDGMDIKYGDTGVPIVLNDCVAYLECKVVKKVDVGTHWMFIGELVNAELINESLEPITYAFYREVKKGIAPKNAPTYIDKSKLEKKSNAKAAKDAKKYKCTACGFIYDDSKEDTPFEELPESWECPICGAEKEDFIEI